MNERVTFQRAFNDRIYTYAFGSNIGQLSVQITAFLSTSADIASSAFNTMVNAYAQGRVSVSRKEAVLSFGANNVMRGVVLGMEGHTADVVTGIHQFTLSLAVVTQPGTRRPSGSARANTVSPTNDATATANAGSSYSPWSRSDPGYFAQYLPPGAFS